MTVVATRLELRIPRPHAKQRELLDRRERFKLARWGRRAGKNIVAEQAAIIGHGAYGTDGTRGHKGLMHGRDVLWVARSLRQAQAIWDGEVRPRFRAAFGDDATNDTKMIARMPGVDGGALIVCSQDADSIANARGLGARIGGIVGDEVAHWDRAEKTWLEILLPILTDNEGWALFISTTEPGSWFNAQCEAEADGTLTQNWVQTHATAWDNPRLTRTAIETMIAEYPAGDSRLAKEVYADLTVGGAGFAFPEWNPAVHLASFRPPANFRWVVGVDWGYTSIAAAEYLAIGPEERVHHVYEQTFTETEPLVMGRAVGRCILERGWPVEWVVGDDQMWQQSAGPITVAERFQTGLYEGNPATRLPLVPATKGAGSREARKMLTHAGLAHTVLVNGVVPSWGRPRWTFDPIGCPNLVKNLPLLRKEVKKLDGEDVAIDQVKKDGREHWWDAATYAHVERLPVASTVRRDVPEDVHPGLLPDGSRRHRRPTPDQLQDEMIIEYTAHGWTNNSSYGGRTLAGRGE